MKNIFLYILLSMGIILSCPSEAADLKNRKIQERPTFNKKEQLCGNNIKSRGNRNLGMDILNVASGKTYDDNIAALRSLKGNFQTFHITWSSLENADGKIEDTNNYLAMISAATQQNNLKLSLTIRPIDATGKTVPSDLEKTDFNDPKMIRRFNNLIDFVFKIIPKDSLVNLMIGNEINDYNPTGDENFWIEYAQFLKAQVKYIKKKYPGVKVGFTASYEGFTDHNAKTKDGWPETQVLQTLSEYVNVVGITYYPLNSDFSVRNPNTVLGDFKKILESVPKNTPIHIQELGYPSSENNKSNETQQALFFCEAMAAWDKYSNRIQNLAVLRLNDISASQASDMAGPYGYFGDGFKEYLRTLGVRDNQGNPKRAYDILKQETQRRRF